MIRYSYEDLQDALEAIVRCDATDEAYVVAKQFGYHELFPGCIYREENFMAVEITTARRIIERAKQDEMYEAPMPEDDATAIKEAEGLIQMAEQAWAQNWRGPEVQAILALANDGEIPSNGSYEAEQHEKAAEEADSRPLIDLSNLDASLTKMEPWEGYGEMSVAEVTEGVNYYSDQSDYADLLKHVYAYEGSRQKPRVRILKHVQNAFEGLGYRVAAQEGEPAEKSSTEAPERDAEAAPDETQSAEGGTEAAVEDAEDSSTDAGDDAEPEASEPESETGVDEAEPDEKDSSSGSKLYDKLIETVDRELQAERVDIPEPPTDTPPELPWRWNEIGDIDLHNFHMQYAAMAYYKSYVYARHERIAMHAKQAADEMHNKIMVELPKYDHKEKEKKVGLIEAEIESNPSIRRWRRIQHRAEQMAAQARREMDSYYKLVESLSRLETMRHQAWERARK